METADQILNLESIKCTKQQVPIGISFCPRSHPSVVIVQNEKMTSRNKTTENWERQRKLKWTILLIGEGLVRPLPKVSEWEYI